jgi:4'-phosphopantetheinyl transferase
VPHSHEIALYAIVATRDIGVDIEHLRPMPDAEAIATRFFSKDEQAVISALSGEERDRAFFACWTRKEAFIKALGEGLYYPLDHFSVSILSDKPVRLLRVKDNPPEADAWHLHAFIPASEYIAALAIRQPITSIRYFWLS